MNTLAATEIMKITKLKEHIGAEVTGIDLCEPIDEATRQRIYDAVVDNVVLVIRGQQFSAAQYQAAAELFGELMEDQNRRYLVDGLPLVSVLSNRHKDSQGNEWKQRITGMQTACSLLSPARFKIANPDIVRDQLTAKVPPTIQPLVRTHPERGTKAIWFHKGKTENVLGMAPEETQEFLDELLAVAMRPEFVYVHEYKLGDMLVVDNRSAMHKAGFDYDHSQHRMLYRILVRGARPF
jgi:taurine dioxygenase